MGRESDHTTELGTDLTEADLSGANLYRAHLRGANLCGAKGSGRAL